MKICETSKDQLPILGGFFIGVIEIVLLIVPLIVGLLIWYIALELSVAIRKKHEFMDWWIEEGRHMADEAVLDDDLADYQDRIAVEEKE